MAKDHDVARKGREVEMDYTISFNCIADTALSWENGSGFQSDWEGEISKDLKSKIFLAMI